jgi:hypothetical protein
MPNTLHDLRVAAALDRMFAHATQDEAASQRLGPAADFAAMTARRRCMSTCATPPSCMLISGITRTPRLEERPGAGR